MDDTDANIDIVRFGTIFCDKLKNIFLRSPVRCQKVFGAGFPESLVQIASIFSRYFFDLQFAAGE